MKGIVLAGGSGTRLYPLTKGVSKQLLPIYDKPTIYYPISVLMLAGIRDIIIISTPRDLPLMKVLLGDGSELGLSFSYIVQPKPEGIAQAFLLAQHLIEGEKCALILGDNLFYGSEILKKMEKAVSYKTGATVFAYRVHDPQNYGVMEFDNQDLPKAIVEKPSQPKSNWAIPGLYFYDENVVEFTKTLKPSNRNELEISHLNALYLQKNCLNVERLGRGIAWLDSGTPHGLLSASHFVQTIEDRQGLKVACLEEIALQKGFIDINAFSEIARNYPNSSYGDYLRNLLKQGLIT